MLDISGTDTTPLDLSDFDELMDFSQYASPCSPGPEALPSQLDEFGLLRSPSPPPLPTPASPPWSSSSGQDSSPECPVRATSRAHAGSAISPASSPCTVPPPLFPTHHADAPPSHHLPNTELAQSLQHRSYGQRVHAPVEPGTHQQPRVSRTVKSRNLQSQAALPRSISRGPEHARSPTSSPLPALTGAATFLAPRSSPSCSTLQSLGNQQDPARGTTTTTLDIPSFQELCTEMGVPASVARDKHMPKGVLSKALMGFW